MWSKHGYIYCFDISVCMDVKRNPDQDLDVVNNNGKHDLSYSKSKIITLQKVATKPDTDFIETYKINQLFKYS